MEQIVNKPNDKGFEEYRCECGQRIYKGQKICPARKKKIKKVIYEGVQTTNSFRANTKEMLC